MIRDTNRLQNSRVFFLKISKEIGKAWLKSLEREARERKAREKRLSPVSLSVFNLVPDLSVWLLARTWIRKSTDCLAV